MWRAPFILREKMQGSNPFKFFFLREKAWLVSSFDTVYALFFSRTSTPPQNSQFKNLIGNSKQYVDDFVGELTF
jgi:hypothetical protein